MRGLYILRLFSHTFKFWKRQALFLVVLFVTWSHYIDQAGPKLTEILLASAYPVLGLKVYVTMYGWEQKFVCELVREQPVDNYLEPAGT